MWILYVSLCLRRQKSAHGLSDPHQIYHLHEYYSSYLNEGEEQWFEYT